MGTLSFEYSEDSGWANIVNVYKEEEQRRTMSGKVKTAVPSGTIEGERRVVVAYSTIKVARPTHEPPAKVAVANRGMPESEVRSKVVKVMW